MASIAGHPGQLT